MKKLVTLREALNDARLLADALPGPSWFAWRVLLIAAVGEPLLDDEERAAFHRLTGRDHEPLAMVEILMTVAGRRSGKSKAAAVLAVYLTTLVDWSDCLSLGERGLGLFLSPTERQAGTTFRYAAAIVAHSVLLKSLVLDETKDTLTLSRGVDLTVQPANWRFSRGSTCVVIVLDEVAFLHTSDEAANSDTELMIALQPALATTSGMMVLTSSPSLMEGVLFRLHQRHHGPAGDARVLVVQSPSTGLNPSLSERVIARAFESDPDAAGSEWGGEFRHRTTALLPRELVERAVAKDRPAPEPLPGVHYVAFADTAGGTGRDAFTCGIGHTRRDEGRDIAVIDLLFVREAPFSPDFVTAELCALLRAWGVRRVTADRYGAGWPIVAFAAQGVTYVHSAMSASDLYLHSIAAFTASRVELPNDAKLVDQLAALKRIVGSGGKETVEHPRGQHDDRANAVCGVLALLTPVVRPPVIAAPILINRSGRGQQLYGFVGTAQQDGDDHPDTDHPDLRGLRL